MVFKRYSSPFLFLDNLIIQGKLCDGINTIYKQVDEDKLWNLYLSIPMKEQSYVEWKNEVISKNEEEKPKIEAAKSLEDVRNKAINILDNFKPE